MGSGELLSIEPLELKFTFELKKQISSSLQLSNKTDNPIAFKVKTTNPKKYCVRPNTGIVLPRSTCDIIVTMQAQRKAPLDMECKDKFLLQSVVASPNANNQDINPAMFTKEAGHVVEESKLRVVYVSPPQPLELLSIEPLELKFPFELKKQMSCSLQLSNKTGNHVGFKVKTTVPKKFCVRPNTGIILPWSTCDIIVVMQAQRKAPTNMKCNDKFLIQSVVTSPNFKIQDINRAMFDKEAGHVVEECKLGVLYVSPPQLPSTVQELSEEDSVPHNDNLKSSEFTSVTSSFVKSHSFLATVSNQSEALISKLKEMKINAFRSNSLLRKKLGNNTAIQNDLEKPLLSEYGDKPASSKMY